MSDNSCSLPSECAIRPASAQDIKSIIKLVWSAKLDPTQLRWEQFWVIECEGKLAACGQLRNFAGAQELGSLVVAKDWRDRGLGSYLTKYLIQQATEPLYLECLGKRLASFYTRFGFVEVSVQELPQSLKFKFGLSQLGKTLFKIPVTIMHYQAGCL
ncbi:GNAT family N-acetyltransferase [Microcoleus vaginatus]|uniref:GNAT family N-acetyltransferase n=1 Tax=Microcoleus vaginatus TaxID=119532 RepID=UPI001688CA94|nr:GNAT family N-acetyltransferase [Microcoleus sp. FACHB-84]MBD2011766.1 GNAT family N-acetyltransferase [Microcoleus sp. FACHB-45]